MYCVLLVDAEQLSRLGLLAMVPRQIPQTVPYKLQIFDFDRDASSCFLDLREGAKKMHFGLGRKDWKWRLYMHARARMGSSVLLY